MRTFYRVTMLEPADEVIVVCEPCADALNDNGSTVDEEPAPDWKGGCVACANQRDWQIPPPYAADPYHGN